MKHPKSIIFSALFFCMTSMLSQTTLTMQKGNGVYTVPCKVNGLPLDFIFDTGASDVSISLTEAIFMLKNNLLSKSDIIGSEYYKDATGKISEGTKIILRKVEIGGITLTDVEASVVHQMAAPLLFGQSAMTKLGQFQFDPGTGMLTIMNSPKGSTSQPVKATVYSPAITSFDNCKYPTPIPERLDRSVKEATSYYASGKFMQCISIYDAMIVEFPEYCVAYYNRGLAKFDSGDRSGAQRDWTKAGLLGLQDGKRLVVKYFGGL